jgi:hypothetical protein
MMANKPTRASIATGLIVPERILLVCLASDTDWQAPSITHATAQQMMVRGLIERDRGATRFALRAPMRNVDWTMITLTVAYVLLVPFALWVGLGH